VCEVDAATLELARRHFGLRRMPGLRVRLAEGRAHVATQDDASWDAIVIDAFVAATVPRRLITVEALADVARVAPLALVNVVDNRAALDVRAIAAALARSYRSTWAIGARSGNTVVVGSSAILDLGRIRARAAADPSPPRLTAPGEMASLTASSVALRDADLDPVVCSRATGS
jgi:hypothetical protein